jgi:hypothetical protein
VNTGMRHAFSKALYELDANGNVVVTNGNLRGVFDGSGRWLEGELREADPQLCVWITNVPQAQMNARKSHPLE